MLELGVVPGVAWAVGVALGLEDRVGEDVARETILVTTLASLPAALLVAVRLG